MQFKRIHSTVFFFFFLTCYACYYTTVLFGHRFLSWMQALPQSATLPVHSWRGRIAYSAVCACVRATMICSMTSRWVSRNQHGSNRNNNKNLLFLPPLAVLSFLSAFLISCGIDKFSGMYLSGRCKLCQIVL